MSMALLFAKLNLAIKDNNLSETKEIVKQLNLLSEHETNFVISTFDLQTLSESFENESFYYFLFNITNQQINLELWRFLSGYIPNKYEQKKISKNDVQVFIQDQMKLYYEDQLKEIKYFTLIRLCMMIEDYNTIIEIKNRLEKE